MHFYLYDAVTPAGLTPSSFDIETETTGFISPHTGFRCSGKEFSDISKNTGIGPGIGTGGSPYWRLIDVDDLIDKFDPKDFGVRSCWHPFMIEPLGKDMIEGFQDQGRFSRSGHTGYTYKAAQREFHIDIFEIVLRSPFNDQFFFVPETPVGRDLDILQAGKVLTG
jgi:hypothetical protein